MIEPANEDEFRNEKEGSNRQWAMGYKRDGVTRVGGISNPQKTKLALGDIIFRFGNKQRSSTDDRCGPWWITQETLMLNAEFASNVSGLIATLRQNLALPLAFSPLDRIFGATVIQRLSVFSGTGNGIFRKELHKGYREGAPPLLLGGMELDGSSRSVSLRFQLFIPGLATSGRNALDYGTTLSAIKWFNLPIGQRQWP